MPATSLNRHTHAALPEALGGGHSPEFYNQVVVEAVRFIVAALDAEPRRIASQAVEKVIDAV